MTDPAITHFPTPIREEAFQTAPEERKALVETKIREIMEVIGLDITDPSLSQTPKRVAKMFVEEIFSGLDPKSFPKITLQSQETSNGEIIFVKNIELVSFCEHHFVPMVGTAHVAYIPHGKILGLSKVHRIVRYFARRPQLQERLAAQIADCLALLLKTEDIAVSITAKHFCVIARGVEDKLSETRTDFLRGAFKHDAALRAEFFAK